MKKEIITKIASLIVALALIICSSVMSFVSCSYRSKNDRNTYGFKTSEAAADAFLKAYSNSDFEHIWKTLPRDLVDDFSEYYLGGIDIEEFVKNYSKSEAFTGFDTENIRYLHKRSDIELDEAMDEIEEVFNDDDLSNCYDKFDPDEITSARAENYRIRYDYDEDYSTTEIYTFKYKGRWYTTAMLDEIF